MDHHIFVKLACIPNFSFLGELEVTFSGGVGGWLDRDNKIISVQSNLTGTGTELGNNDVSAYLLEMYKQYVLRLTTRSSLLVSTCILVSSGMSPGSTLRQLFNPVSTNIFYTSYTFQNRESDEPFLPLDIRFINEAWVPNIFIYSLVSFNPLDCLKVGTHSY